MMKVSNQIIRSFFSVVFLWTIISVFFIVFKSYYSSVNNEYAVRLKLKTPTFTDVSFDVNFKTDQEEFDTVKKWVSPGSEYHELYFRLPRKKYFKKIDQLRFEFIALEPKVEVSDMRMVNNRGKRVHTWNFSDSVESNESSKNNESLIGQQSSYVFFMPFPLSVSKEKNSFGLWQALTLGLVGTFVLLFRAEKLRKVQDLMSTGLVYAGLVIIGFFMADFIARKQSRSASKNSAKANSILDYGDTWRKNGMGPGGYLKENFKGEVKGEFGQPVKWENNSMGFRNKKEFARQPLPQTLRVWSMGDSFTAGYRLAQNETFSYLLEKKIENSEVLISCIESPDKGYQKLLTKQIESVNPDLVLLGVTLGNDIFQDYISRHESSIGFNSGLEDVRIPDSALKHPIVNRFKGVTFLEAMAKHSHLFSRLGIAKNLNNQPIANWYQINVEEEPLRMFDPSNGIGLFLEDLPSIMRIALERHCSVLLDYKNFCEHHQAKFIAVLFPQRYQVQGLDWKLACDRYNLDGDAFSLDGPNKYIKNFCGKNKIEFFDLTDSLRLFHRNSGKELYMRRGDMHWNALANSLVADTLKPVVEAFR